MVGMHSDNTKADYSKEWLIVVPGTWQSHLSSAATSNSPTLKRPGLESASWCSRCGKSVHAVVCTLLIDTTDRRIMHATYGVKSNIEPQLSAPVIEASQATAQLLGCIPA